MSSPTDTLASSMAGGETKGRASLPRVWIVFVFMVGLIFSSGYARVLGDLGVTAFKHIARAQYELHQATQNVNTDGRLEFAVLLKGSAADAILLQFLNENAGWQSRAASIPGWAVISAPATVEGVGATLRQQSFSKAVLRNRGIWICH